MAARLGKVIRIINGRKIQLDRHIADLICMMNDRGYPTLWCCSGVTSDHSMKTLSEHADAGISVRLYIRCDRSKYTLPMIDVLLNSLNGIGSVEVNNNIHGDYLDLEFRNAFDRSPFRTKIKIFQKRFKELTNEKLKV